MHLSSDMHIFNSHSSIPNPTPLPTYIHMMFIIQLIQPSANSPAPNNNTPTTKHTSKLPPNLPAKTTMGQREL